MRTSLFALVLGVASAPSASAQFTAGNLVVYQAGSGGANSLVNTGNVVLLTEFTPAGVAGYQLAMPNTASGPSLVTSGTASSEGMLSLGNNGQTLALTGYNAATSNATALPATASATVNRTVALVNGQGTTSLTLLTDYSTGSNPRGAYTTDGNSIFVVGGVGGIRYATVGSTTSTQLSTTTTNLRTVQVAGGQLFVSANSGSTRVAAVGSGVPTTAGQPIVTLPGTPATGSPYQFFLARVGNPSTFSGPNVLYVADDTPGTIVKYTTTDGTNWSAAGSASAAAVRGLTGVVTGDNQITLYGTTGATSVIGGGSLYTFTDSAAQTGTLAGSAGSLATAATNSAYRGIAFAPARLEWAGTGGTWDLAGTNWTNAAPTAPVAGQKFVNAYAANFGSIGADATIAVGPGVSPLAVNVSNASNSYTFANGAGSNGIQGLGSLSKSGAGTLVLASPNTYTGGTAVNGGTLLVNNATGSGTGLGIVAVNATGTLGGTGTISGGVTVAGNGRLRGGDGSTAAGNPTLTTGTITFNNNSRLQATVGGASPGSAVGTKLSAGPAAFNTATPASDVVILDLANDGSLNLSGTQSYTFTLATYGSTNATPSNFSLSPTNFAFVGSPTITVGGSALTVTFTPVPEPAAVLGAAVGSAGFARVIRRRGRTDSGLAASPRP